MEIPWRVIRGRTHTRTNTSYRYFFKDICKLSLNLYSNTGPRVANTILKKNSKVGGTAVLSIIYRTYKPYYVPRIIQTGWYCQEGWTQRSRQWKRERARNRPAPMCPNDFDKGVNPVLGRRDSLVSRWPCCHSTGTGKIMSLIYTSRLA